MIRSPDLIAFTLVAVVSGVMMEGSFWHLIVCILLGLYLLVPAFAVTGLLFFISKTSPRRAVFARLLKIEAAAGALLLLSIFSGYATHAVQEHRIHAYVAKAVPVLENYRAKHGRYPETLAEAGLEPAPAWLDQPGSYYQGSADDFHFSYNDPSEMMGRYFFDSEKRTWIYD